MNIKISLGVYIFLKSSRTFEKEEGREKKRKVIILQYSNSKKKKRLKQKDHDNLKDEQGLWYAFFFLQHYLVRGNKNFYLP